MSAVTKNKKRVILLPPIFMYFLGALLGWSLFLMFYGYGYWILLGIILRSFVNGFMFIIAPSIGMGIRGAKLFIITTLVVFSIAVIIKFNILIILKTENHAAIYVFLSCYLFPYLIKIFFPRQWIEKIAIRDDIQETKKGTSEKKKGEGE